RGDYHVVCAAREGRDRHIFRNLLQQRVTLVECIGNVVSGLAPGNYGDIDLLELSEKRVEFADCGCNLTVGTDAEVLNRLASVVKRADDPACGVDDAVGEIAIGWRRRVELKRLLQRTDGRRGGGGVFHAVHGQLQLVQAAIERQLSRPCCQGGEVLPEQRFVGDALDVDRARAGRSGDYARNTARIVGIGCIRDVSGDDRGLA